MLGPQPISLTAVSTPCDQTFASTLDTVVGALLLLGGLALIVIPLVYEVVIKPGMRPEGGVLPAALTASFYPADRWRIFAMVRNYLLRSGLIPLTIGIVIIVIGKSFGGQALKSCSVFL